MGVRFCAGGRWADTFGGLGVRGQLGFCWVSRVRNGAHLDSIGVEYFDLSLLRQYTACTPRDARRAYLQPGPRLLVDDGL